MKAIVTISIAFCLFACNTNLQEGVVKPEVEKTHEVLPNNSEILYSDSTDADYVSFNTVIEMEKLHKDGAIVMNGLIVHIGDEKAKELNGKRVRISGEVTIYDSYRDDWENWEKLKWRLSDFSYSRWLISCPLQRCTYYSEYNTAGCLLYGKTGAEIQEDTMQLIQQRRIGRFKEIYSPKIEILK